jgi:hypothetical protein
LDERPEADLRRTASDLTSLGLSLAVLLQRYAGDETLAHCDQLVTRMQASLTAVINQLKE